MRVEATSSKQKIGELVLCCHSAYFGPRQYCLKGKRFYERTAKKTWPQISEPRNNVKSDSLYLANELGRPFYHLLALPLESVYEFKHFQPCLFIEYFSNKSIPQNFPEEKWNILKPAFSKVLMEEHWKSGRDLWKNTFDSLEEPLALLDENRKPVRSNIHFQKIYKKQPFLCSKTNLQEEGQIYERQSYSISQEKTKYTIEHFVNITSYLLLREKMAQNQKMSTLGKLADSIAHRLHNPLTGICSMAQIISQSAPEKKQNFSEIEEATQRCQKIISNFIHFSKQESKNSFCDLNTIVKQTIPFLKTMIETKKLSLHLDQNSFLVQASPCPLQQVIFNLVLNALQAVDQKGSVLIQSHFDHSQKKATLKVKDEGCGISPSHLKKIFDPFFTTKSKGTGLGLRISSLWIKKFGGRIMVESQEGKGSSFSFTLPKAVE